MAKILQIFSNVIQNRTTGKKFYKISKMLKNGSSLLIEGTYRVAATPLDLWGLEFLGIGVPIYSV